MSLKSLATARCGMLTGLGIWGQGCAVGKQERSKASCFCGVEICHVDFGSKTWVMMGRCGNTQDTHKSFMRLHAHGHTGAAGSHASLCKDGGAAHTRLEKPQSIPRLHAGVTLIGCENPLPDSGLNHLEMSQLKLGQTVHTCWAQNCNDSPRGCAHCSKLYTPIFYTTYKQ